MTLCCLSLLLFSPPFFQLLITSSPTFVHSPLIFHLISSALFSLMTATDYLCTDKEANVVFFFFFKETSAFKHLLTILMDNTCIMPPWSCSEMIKTAGFSLHQSQWTYTAARYKQLKEWRNVLAPACPQQTTVFLCEGRPEGLQQEFQFHSL